MELWNRPVTRRCKAAFTEGQPILLKLRLSHHFSGIKNYTPLTFHIETVRGVNLIVRRHTLNECIKKLYTYKKDLKKIKKISKYYTHVKFEKII
jgi:hypothetical protein